MIEEGATFVGKSEVTPNKVAMKPEIVRDPESSSESGRGRAITAPSAKPAPEVVNSEDQR